ncbi:MAG: hypothetical protein ACE5DN_03820, partial [Flavobacteriales bacterium]
TIILFIFFAIYDYKQEATISSYYYARKLSFVNLLNDEEIYDWLLALERQVTYLLKTMSCFHPKTHHFPVISLQKQCIAAACPLKPPVGYGRWEKNTSESLI